VSQSSKPLLYACSGPGNDTVGFDSARQVVVKIPTTAHKNGQWPSLVCESWLSHSHSTTVVFACWKPLSGCRSSPKNTYLP